jgi:hypothetical protein
MSYFQTEKVACPSCANDVEFDVVFSVNAVARPDLRQAILEESFQRESCSECGLAFRVDPAFTYLDAEGKQWILVRPFADRQEWPSMEDYARKFYDIAFGPTAPAASRRIGQGMACRIVFGWNALKEKLLALDLGLDDATLELTKLALIRTSEKSPMSDDTELRFLAANDKSMLFGWYEAETGKVLETLELPRQAYEQIAADQSAWKELHDQVAAGPMVDVSRMWVETVDPAPAT